MDILGIGPLEIIFIIIIALIVFGPKDMVKAGKTIGRFLRQMVTSPTWSAVQQTSKEIRNLPNKLIREAGIDEDMEEIKNILPDKNELLPNFTIDHITRENSETSQNIGNDKSTLDTNISAWTTPPSKEYPPEKPDPPENEANI